MRMQIDHVLSKVRPRIVTMLRTRDKYSTESMIQQYKSHVLGLLEHSNSSILHACDSQLQRLDSVQRRFLHGLALTEEIAFRVYNLAPPTLRRDIGVLGLIHKRVLGLAHPAYSVLLPWAPPLVVPPGGILTRHNKQLDSHGMDVIFNHGLFFRSIFGLTEVYNRLPQIIVNFDTVKDFQAALTNMARYRCSRGAEHWKYSFNSVHLGSFVYSADA